MRRSILIAAAAIAVAATVLAAAPADAATYRDPLTRGDLVSYDHHDYRLSIAPVAGAKRVVRFGHSVPATYSVRLIEPGAKGDTVLFSARLGYSRTAYLRIKTVSADAVRGFGIRTYVRKVTGFSAAYAAKRVAAFAAEQRHRTQRGDVAATVTNAKAFIAAHGGTAGITGDRDVVVRSDGFFGYEHARIDLIPGLYRSGSTRDFAVYGFDPTDGYQVLYDSTTGRTTSTTSEDDRALLQ